MLLVWALAGLLAGVFLYHAIGLLGWTLSRSRMRADDYDGALRWLRWTSFGMPGVKLLCDEGLILCQAGRLAEAERVCRKGLAKLKDDSAYPRLRGVLGFVFLDGGHYGEAEQSFQCAIEAGEQTGSSYSGLAELALVQGAEAEKALAYTAQGIARAQRLPGGRVHWAHHMNQAWALALLGRDDEARESLALALGDPAPVSSASGVAERHWRAGLALLALRQTEEARKHFRMGKDADPRGKYGRRCKELLRTTA